MKPINLAVVSLESVTPYSPSRNYTAEVPKLKDESADAYDERTWRHHAHASDGKSPTIVIPGECFAWSLKAMSKRRSDRIPGKGQKTYTAAFDPTEVIGSIDTGVDVSEPEMEAFMANADGVRGSGKRVLRRFPRVDAWAGKLTYLMWDVRITEQVFGETIEDAGLLIGIGRRRPENKGMFGRYRVARVEWRERVDPATVLGVL